MLWKTLMSSIVNACLIWVRRNWHWSNSRQSWEERIGALFLFTGAGLLLWFAARLSLTQQVLYWGLLILALAVLMRRGWLKLFGPVLFYDLVRMARRSRYFLVRSLYALFLLLVLAQVGFSVRESGPMPAREAAQAALGFFFTFMVVQIAVTAFLTPAYVAGAIAEEKERKPLEFLLATDLRNREIVLSKLGARLANLGLIVLTGLPILSLIQIMGGVNPELVLVGFAFTGLTVVGLAGLSIFVSVYLKKPRDAIALTYLGAIAYFALALTGLALITPMTGLGQVPLTPGSNPYTLADLVETVNAGNIIYVGGHVATAMYFGNLSTTVPGLLRNYAIFHGLVAVGFTALAVARLRAVAIKQGEAKSGRGVWRLWRRRPRVGSVPMVWKEVFVEGGFRFHWLGAVILLVMVALSLLPVALIFYYNFFNEWGPGTWKDLAGPMNVYVRTAGTVVACLSLLAVAVRAATAIGSERDRQTLDALLTSPLDSSEILFGKWLGSIVGVRWSWLWLGLIWGLGVVTGGLSPVAVLVLTVIWWVYAAALAGLGLWFSVVCRTTTRATVATLLTALGAGLGHWLLTMCCFVSAAGRGAETLAKLQAGFTPPFVMGLFAFWEEDLNRRWARRELSELAGYCLFGLICTALVTWGLWHLASARFRFITGRPAFRSPDRSDPFASSRRVGESPRAGGPDRKYLPPVVAEEVVEDENNNEGPGEGPDPRFRTRR
jgi:ABC-type transport system involved in multi-copper enzyme maturation permease subunit